jgi:hypothetical protein
VQLSLKLKVEGWTEGVSNNERIQDDINHIPHTMFYPSNIVHVRTITPKKEKEREGKTNQMPCEKEEIREISTGEVLYIPRREINW